MDLVVGAAKVVVNILLGLVKTVAWLGDSLNKVFGIDSHMRGFIDDIQKELVAKVDLGTTVLKASPSTSPGVAAASNARAAAVAHAPAMSYASEPQEVTVRAHVQVDGEKVGTAIANKAKRSGDARSFMPVASGEIAGAF